MVLDSDGLFFSSFFFCLLDSHESDETNDESGSISTTVFGFIIRGPTPFSRIVSFRDDGCHVHWMCDLEGPTLFSTCCVYTARSLPYRYSSEKDADFGHGARVVRACGNIPINYGPISHNF